MCLTYPWVCVTLAFIRGPTIPGPSTRRADMADLQPAPAETPETSLRKGRIGVLGIVFFVIAYMV